MEDIRDDIQEKVEESKPEPKQEESTPSGLQEFNALRNATTTDMVVALQNKKALELAETNPEIQQQIEENAKQTLNNSLQEVSHQSNVKVNKAHFELHKSASKMYGFKEERPLWQQRMMVIGSSIWFVIYFIVASVTVCPLTVFFDVLKNIFKKGWLAMLVAVVMYVLVVAGIPAIITLINGTNGVVIP